MSAKTERPRRLAFIDNLRVLLTVLVILHHLVSTYLGLGDWYYREGSLTGISALVLTVFMVVNQSFFMGAFYLIAGYFSPGAYDRKGPAGFLRDRLVRLGIPLVVYALLINPFTRYAAEIGVWGLNRRFLRVWGVDGVYWQYAARVLRERRGSIVGPLWFVEALLIFALAYWVWRVVVRPAPLRAQRDSRPPRNLAIAAFALLLGLVTFLVRLRLPIGWALEPLGLQFPHFPQYVGVFIAGVAAYRRNWFLTITDGHGRLWTGVAVVLIALFPVILTISGGDVDPLRGGLRWQAAAFAFWEQMLGVAMMVSLLVLFRGRFDRQGKLAKAMAASSYAAFVLHGPVLVLLAVRMSGVRQSPLVKMAVIAPAAVFLCFGIGWVLRQVPLVNRVL